MSSATLFALRANGKLIQVTSKGVALFSEQEGLISTWKALDGDAITFATGNEDCLLVVVGGRMLVNLDLRNASRGLTPRKRKTLLMDISCLIVPKADPEIAVLGFWGSSGMMIIDLESFAILTSDLLAEGENGAVPRSLVLTWLVSPELPTLLVGMADGTLYSFSYNPMDKSISDPSKIYLGDNPIRLFEIPRTDELNGVYAACGQSSIIYGSHEHLVYSKSTAQNVRYAAPIRTRDEGLNYVAFASADSLNVEALATDRSIHTTSYAADSIVRRIVHWKEKRIIAAVLANIDRNPVTKIDIMEGCLKIYDDAEFGVYDSHDLRSGEIPETVSLVKVPDENGKLTEMLAVGTVFISGGDSDVERGRLLLFKLVNDKKLRLVLEQDLGLGAIRSIQDIEGRLVIGSALHASLPSSNVISSLTLC